MWIVWLEKKILKTLGIILGIIIILITALHFYVVNNAESLIEEIVSNESKGKLKAKIGNIKFNYFSKKVELDDVTFFSNDSLDLKTSYHFHIDKIKLKVKALVPIFTRRELRIDSLALMAPQIEVTRLKPLRDTSQSEISIPREMGRIYNSIMDALKFLEIKRFQFDEGQFNLINKILPDQQPLVITGMHFHIENFKVDSTTDAEDFPESDKLVFWTKNQDITFPDGNHRLAFSRFRIKIKKRLIEIDSCTLIGKKDGISQSGYSVFLDTLKLTNVDFKSLYEKDLIKADTVYCLNPNLKLQLELKDRVAGAKRKVLNLDTLINQLTGDLQLGYIGVKNAALNISTTRNDKTTSFTSDKNNFEMTGLRIDHSSPQPVSLEGFDMAIHNYENFVKDSSFFLRFDSIRLRENRILLSNFSINTEPYKDKRNIKVQQFVLSGLSWADLLFDRRVVARQATLLRPVIDYTQPAVVKKRNRNPIANSLAGITNFMSLEKIHVENGKIRIKTRNDIELLLDDAFIIVNTGNIDSSVSIEEAESSVDSLHFKKGVMKTKRLMVNMDNAFFSGAKNDFQFEKINLYDHQQSFNVNARNIFLDSVGYNDIEKKVSANGTRWGHAIVEINLFSDKKRSANDLMQLLLSRIKGNNTQVYINSEKGSFSVFLDDITSPSSALVDGKLKIDGLKTSGRELYWYDQKLSVASAKFSFADNAFSTFDSLQFRQTKNNNKIDITVPEVNFIPDLSSIINKKPKINDLKFKDPVVAVNINSKNSDSLQKPLPDFAVNNIEIENPVFLLENTISTGLQKLSWNGNSTKLLLRDIRSDNQTNQLSVASATTKLTAFAITNADNKTTESKEGSLDVQLSDLQLKPGKEVFWTVRVNEVIARNFSADSIGKKPATIKIHEGVLKNLVLGSDIKGSIKAIIEKNPSFTISSVSGYMIDEKNNWKLSNLSFDKPAHTISADSFLFHPVQSIAAFSAESKWQRDYMTLKTGKINVTKFNLDQYLEDSVFRTGNISIDSAYFTSYRDKTPPFRAGIIKPLPTKLIERIPFKVSVDTVLVSNGTAVYTELNDKTRESAVVPITKMSGDIFPIKNFDLTPTDTFRIRLNGYLLDTGWIRLRTRESYMDTSSGFLITLRMRPHSMLYLNKILEPLSSVRVQSGYLDTLTMRAVGRERLALGEMRMYYHDLKVQFLNNGKENKKKFLQGLVTFLANSFVIKNNNTKRVGVVYFPRWRDRSFINYYIKIAMSGVASSVGAKKNKRLMRRYNKQLKIRQLPPSDID